MPPLGINRCRSQFLPVGIARPAQTVQQSGKGNPLIRSTAVILLTLAALPLTAQESQHPASPYLEEFLPHCAEPPKIEARDYSESMPAGMKADLMTIQGTDPNCRGMFLSVVKGDRIYVGQPWMLAGYEGAIPQKIKRFAWDRLEESATATVSDRRTPEGLLEVTVEMTTSWGKMRLEGAVDEAGKVFFPGGFDPIAGGARKARLESVRSVLNEVPRKGNANAAVELVEFSDFQCPSCRHASEWMPDLLEKYGDRISYRRADYPLMSSHPWAFAAALYGRAIWEQSPDSFWQYKDEVYQNQGSLTTFTIEDFARDFVTTNQLDVDVFDQAINSDALKQEILAGVSAGMIAEVNATPTFWVNGQPVAAGSHGEHLMKVIDIALEQTGE